MVSRLISGGSRHQILFLIQINFFKFKNVNGPRVSRTRIQVIRGSGGLQRLTGFISTFNEFIALLSKFKKILSERLARYRITSTTPLIFF